MSSDVSDAHATPIRDVFDVLGSFVALVGLDGRLIDANASALSLVSTVPSEVCGRLFREGPWWRDSGEKQSQVQSAIDVAAGGEAVSYEVDVLDAEGQPHLLDLSFQPVSEAGGLRYILVQGQDITARRETEVALRDSERRLRQMFDHAAIGQVLIDLEGHWVMVNHAMCELLGYSRMELLGGAHFASLNVAEDEAPDLSQLGRLISGEISRYRVDKRYRRKDGRVVPVQIDVTLLTDAAGAPQYFAAQMQDIGLRSAAFGPGEVAPVTAPSVAELIGETEEAGWRSRIETALEEDRLELHGQRILALDGVTPPSFEVLVRLREDHTLLAPRDFLPAAERLGLSIRIDRYVTLAALDFLRQLLRSRDVPQGYLSINLSAATLGDESFAEFVREEISGRGIDARHLRFEINEAAVLADREASRRFFEAMRTVGCKTLIDNFGRRFDAYEFVRSLPADGVKIDALHTRNLGGAGDISRAFVETVCRNARDNNREVIAEGVENARSAALFHALGASHLQGHLVHVPEPLAEATS